MTWLLLTLIQVLGNVEHIIDSACNMEPQFAVRNLKIWALVSILILNWLDAV